MSRYIVGIDLGTTNCAVAKIDKQADNQADNQSGDNRIEIFPVPQVVAEGVVEPRETMPSFLLLPNELEVAPQAMSLPWADSPSFAVGAWARDRGGELPHRLISSAKSWLCNGEVDRTAAILPWRGAELEELGGEGARLSPVEASSMYLAHIRDAWNHAHPEAPLEEQDVLLTVPASFDAVARELTVAAAQQAGLATVTLLEEPQAAFYAWLARHHDGWRNDLVPGDVVLVCDIGGGTTDFSIIRVIDDGTGNLALERVAVGDHILLGGDNIDLALAYLAQQQLGEAGSKLSPMQARGLVHACRRAKEQLLGNNAPASVPITVLGRGSKLIGGTLRTDLERETVREMVVDGFFPEVTSDARPQKRRAVGMRELGLPYASDPAVTRHLAAFVGRQGEKPSALLFNGGVMGADVLRERVTGVLDGWVGGGLRTLRGADFDRAVAHGAAYYGLVRQGKGIRIRGGTARAYYIGIEAAMPAIPGFAPPVKALCVAPFGMEEGSAVKLPDEELGLVVGETAEFRFFASSERTEDAPGALVDPEATALVELAPVETTLAAEGGAAPGDTIPVSLESRVSELGTLELWCVARQGPGAGKARWKLEYSVRHKDHP